MSYIRFDPNVRIPQAAGAAYALKIDEERQGDCVIVYFGDGK